MRGWNLQAAQILSSRRKKIKSNHEKITKRGKSILNTKRPIGKNTNQNKLTGSLVRNHRKKLWHTGVERHSTQSDRCLWCHEQYLSFFSSIEASSPSFLSKAHLGGEAPSSMAYSLVDGASSNLFSFVFHCISLIPPNVVIFLTQQNHVSAMFFLHSRDMISFFLFSRTQRNRYTTESCFHWISNVWHNVVCYFFFFWILIFYLSHVGLSGRKIL